MYWLLEPASPDFLLRKAGIKCTVFESEASADVRRREWGMTLHWSLPLLRDLLPTELWDKLYTAQNDPTYVAPETDGAPVYHLETGDLMKILPAPGARRVSRSKFRKLCSNGIDVQYGKSITGLAFGPNPTDAVTATFGDGTSVSGTILVGADGARSAVRRLMFGGSEIAAPTSIPYTALNLAPKFNDASKSLFVRQNHPIYSMAFGPGGFWVWISIQDAPEGSNPEDWTFQLMSSWKGVWPPGFENTDANRLAALKEKVNASEKFCEPFRSAVLWIPEGTAVTQNMISYWIPIPWDTHSGRVTLVGDAAHPMTFHRGQGLNHAVNDCYSFTNALRSLSDTVDLASAIDTYEAEMRPRSESEVKQSVENTHMLHDWSRIQQSALFTKSVVKEH